VLAFIIAAFVNPTLDPLNQIVYASILLVFLELGIQLSKLITKNKRVATEGVG